MGLFSKKKCDLCGNSMGMIIDKKLKDGGICKECAKKLSVWFDEYRNSTLDDIKAQMADREENRKKLDSFVTTYAFGDFGCILIDEEHRQFVALGDTSEGFFDSVKTVTDLSEIIDRNPDIISFDQIEEVKIKETVNSKEETRTVDGKQVSYNPKHMTYMTSFAIGISIKDHPYIHYVYIPLVRESIHIKCEEPRKVPSLGEVTAAWLLDRPEARVDKKEKLYTHDRLINLFYNSPYDLPDYSFGFKVNTYNCDKIKQYRAYLLMSQEIKNILEEKGESN